MRRHIRWLTGRCRITRVLNGGILNDLDGWIGERRGLTRMIWWTVRASVNGDAIVEDCQISSRGTALELKNVRGPTSMRRRLPVHDHRERPAFLSRKQHAVPFSASPFHDRTPSAPPARCSTGRPAVRPPATRLLLNVAIPILHLDCTAKPDRRSAMPDTSSKSTEAEY